MTEPFKIANPLIIAKWLTPEYLAGVNLEQLEAHRTDDFDPWMEDDIERWNLVSAEMRRRGIDAQDMTLRPDEKDEEPFDD